MLCGTTAGMGQLLLAIVFSRDPIDKLELTLSDRTGDAAIVAGDVRIRFGDRGDRLMCERVEVG